MGDLGLEVLIFQMQPLKFYEKGRNDPKKHIKMQIHHSCSSLLIIAFFYLTFPSWHSVMYKGVFRENKSHCVSA